MPGATGKEEIQNIALVKSCSRACQHRPQATTACFTCRIDERLPSHCLLLRKNAPPFDSFQIASLLQTPSLLRSHLACSHHTEHLRNVVVRANASQSQNCPCKSSRNAQSDVTDTLPNALFCVQSELIRCSINMWIFTRRGRNNDNHKREVRNYRLTVEFTPT